MGVYKGTKNNQNIKIIPGLSHYLEERMQSNSRMHTLGK
jgi:hypothetical protein